MLSNVDIIFVFMVLVTLALEIVKRRQVVKKHQEIAAAEPLKVIWRKMYLICSVLFLLLGLARLLDPNDVDSAWVPSLIAVAYLFLAREKVEA